MSVARVMPAWTVTRPGLAVDLEQPLVTVEAHQRPRRARGVGERVAAPDHLDRPAGRGRAATTAASSSVPLGRAMTAGAQRWLPAQLDHTARSADMGVPVSPGL